MLIVVMIIEDLGGKIASSGPSLCDHLGADGASVISLADQSHEIDKRFAGIKIFRSVFGGRVVHGKRVVVVVESLADRAQTHEQILGRVDGLVVGSVTPHVRHTIDQPCEM